ncbi:hypothetical protein H0W91_00955 [Patescibacteria group bacterium]|nr:hypothetical protein [Patescibacteria group bacterium]
MTTVLFVLSLFVLFMLVVSKIFETKVKKIGFLSDLFHKGDVKIHALINHGISKYNLYRKIMNLFLFDFLPSYLYELIVRLKDYVAKKYYSAGDDLRGRRILRSNGSVSFFLERLSEERPGIKSNKV